MDDERSSRWSEWMKSCRAKSGVWDLEVIKMHQNDQIVKIIFKICKIFMSNVGQKTPARIISIRWTHLMSGISWRYIFSYLPYSTKRLHSGWRQIFYNLVLESNQFQDLKNLRNFGYFAGFWYIWSELEKIDDVILSSLFGQFLGSHDLKMPSVLLIFQNNQFFLFSRVGNGMFMIKESWLYMR